MVKNKPINMKYIPETGIYEQSNPFNFANLKGTFAQMKNAAASGQPWWNSLWSKSGGIKLGNIGQMANIGSGIGQGVSAISNLSNISSSDKDLDTLKRSIMSQHMSNPLANSYLTPDQKSLIRKIRSGRYNDNGASGIMEGIGSGLMNTVKDTGLGFLTGGIPGALIGGIGGLVNSGMQGYNNVQQSKASELEALYQALADADMQYQSMKRVPMSGLGLQQRYVNMYQ